MDDYPYGGGPGMVMMPQPIFDCYNYIVNTLDLKENEKPRVIYLSPKVKPLIKRWQLNFLKKIIIMLCGHYEGLIKGNRWIVTDEISIGDYVLTVVKYGYGTYRFYNRLLPGRYRKSILRGRNFYSGLLEYQYTRPASFRGLDVPDVLISGNHQKIDEWRRKESLKLTYKRRPELLKNIKLTGKDRDFLNSVKKATIKSNID